MASCARTVAFEESAYSPVSEDAAGCLLADVQQHVPPELRSLLGKESLRKRGLADAIGAVEGDGADVLIGHGRLQLPHPLRDVHQRARRVAAGHLQRPQQMRLDLADQRVVSPVRTTCADAQVIDTVIPVPGLRDIPRNSARLACG